ncbi:adhesin [Pseudonocardia sp.]|uniref:adhesin n=1 Tax=Pseudonocardia sp. TaxID=60912 RepID=UPI003D11BD5B
MLAVTDIAAEAIKSLTTDAQIPRQGGLRITTAETGPAEGGLQLALAPEPVADDVVVGDPGSAVFLEPAAAAFLDDMVLDVEAAPTADGGQELRFALAPKPAEA